MAKDFYSGSDLRLDVRNDTDGKADSDFGGDLASYNGVDLNDVEISKTDVAKGGFVRGGAALGATTVATFVGAFGGLKPNEGDISIPPPNPVHQEFKPPSQDPNPDWKEHASNLGQIIEDGDPTPESDVKQYPEAEYADSPPAPPPDYAGRTPEQAAEQIDSSEGD